MHALRLPRSRFAAAFAVCASIAVAAPALAALPPAIDGQALPSLAPMLERVTPAVVNINSKTRLKVQNPFFDDPMFRRFFGMPNGPRERVQQSLGSGVVVDASKGYVLTNNHVVEGADDVSVTVGQSRLHDAVILARDQPNGQPILTIRFHSGLAIGARRTVTVWHIDWIRTARWPASRPQPLRSGWRRCWRFRLGHTPIPAPRSDRWSST